MTDTRMLDEHLPCDLNQLEIHGRGEEIAKLLGDRDAAEISKKEAADHHNAEIKEIEGHLSRLAKEVRERREYRWVPVKQVRVENTHLIQWIRTDTDEIVRERPMTEAERQLELLPGVPADDSVASGTDS